MKYLAASLLAALLLAGVSAALAQGATYVFPYEGFRYTQKEGETVLTQTNLDEHAALLESLGTTKEAVLASYMASRRRAARLPSAWPMRATSPA